jgi:hypothetical protein
LHIGINNYAVLKEKEFASVKESHNEAKAYLKFFKEDLNYHNSDIITDEEIDQIKLRDKIIKKLDEIFKNKSESKENIFKVNVISFSGHGITFDGDAIGVIPQKENNDEFTTRFINFSGYARKFA